jgi:hypothetical protein
MRRASELEQSLDGAIAQAEGAAAQASDEADAAVQNASLARDRGQSARLAFDAAARSENQAYEEKAVAEAAVASSSATILALLNQTARSFDAIGVRSSAGQSGDASQGDASRQLADLVLLAERTFAGEDVADSRSALEQSLASADPPVSELARLVIERQLEPVDAPR